MVTFAFFIVLLITVQIINTKNSTKANEDVLEFSRVDSIIIAVCLLSTFILNRVANLFEFKTYWLVVGVSSFVYSMILMVVNLNRERLIQKKQSDILKIYQALQDIFGKVDPENIDYTNVPFEYEENKKVNSICKIIIDTATDGKFNENTIILAQYSINKYFPDLQWLSTMDYPKRELTFKGLPKPPKIANYPGSDYRPTGWIPLGLVTNDEEVGWNMAGISIKDAGFSSYINEDNKTPETVDMPSAPQCLTLGSTGGGKSIYINQKIKIKK